MTKAKPQKWETGALTADLMHKLRADRWIAVAEVVVQENGNQRADVLAMVCSSSRPRHAIFEIKTARSDLLRDLKAEKWRGYLEAGPVVFAFPEHLARVDEIPKDAGVIVRIAQGWSWRRSPGWSKAAQASPYLLRRLVMSAADQYAAKARRELTGRGGGNIWSLDRTARSETGRKLAKIAQNLETFEMLLAESEAKWHALQDTLREADRERWEARREQRKAERLAGLPLLTATGQ